jgi:hypothetical protein
MMGTMTWLFNPAPGWPVPPGFVPPPGWVPDPLWPPAPAGWVFWVPAAGPPGASARPPRGGHVALVVGGIVAAVALVVGLVGAAAGLGWYAGNRLGPVMDADDACSYSVEDLSGVDPDALPTPRQARRTAESLQDSADQARAAAGRDAQYADLADALQVVADAWSTIADLPEEQAAWSVAQRREVAALVAPVREARGVIEVQCDASEPDVSV